MSFQKIELNMIPHGDMPSFYASQYETGRPIIIDVMMGEDAFACDDLYVELHCRKVDDNIVTLEPDSVDGNQVTFVGTEQLFACPGENLAELCLYADETKDTSLGSLNFFIEVEPDPLAGGLTSETQIYDLYEQVEEITQQVIGDDYYDKTETDALLDAKADKSTTYTKTEVDTALNLKADKLTTYTKTETNALLAGKADASDTYTKAQVDSKLSLKADKATTYTKTETDTLLGYKANLSQVYTRSQTDTLLDNKADKSTTYTKTQVDNALALKANTADLATVATTGDYDDLTNKPTIPAAQVQSDWEQSDNTKVDYIKNKPDLSVYVTSDALGDIIYDLLPTGTASGAIANFDTDLSLPLVDCKAYIVASQPSGTPTPSSPLAISGYTGVNLGLCDNNDITPYLRGCYLGTYGFIDLSTLSYIVESQYSRFRTTITNLKYVSAAVKANIILNGYTTNTANYFDSHSTEDLQITTDNNTNILYIRNLSCSTSDELRSALSGKILLYELKTPTTPVITSTDYANILTSFNANGTTYAVSWQDEAGTVYGGNLDLTSGVLTVTYTQPIKLSDLAGWSYDSTYQYFYTTISDKKIGNTNLLCECYSVVDKASATQLLNGEMKGHSSSRNVYIKDTNYNDVTNWLNAVGDNKLTYELATPVTYQLTPVQVQALLGVNNIYNDTNGDTEVKYKDSIQHYIDTRI